MESNIIINQLLAFIVLAVIGAIASWRKIINDEGKDFLSKLIIDVTLPLLIVSTFLKLESNPRLLVNGLWLFVLTFVNIGVLYMAGTLSARAQKLSPSDSTVHVLHTMFGNIVFLGFPLFDALFPNGVGVFYASVYQLASNFITYTYGTYKLSAGVQKSKLGNFFNINTIALLLGILLMVLKVKLPAFILEPISSLGKCTSPLSMVYIGALLAGMNLKSTFKTTSIYVLTINKLIIVPLLLGFIYSFLRRSFNLNLSIEAFVVLVMQAAMPCQTIVVVMSRRYGGSHVLATGNLFISTIFSIISLPLVYHFLVSIYS
ncbi:MAG TPA: AEC family transporter [Tenuifilaceae bacterium]|nr:AEC family transporter [Tenuifilaceae bacterium]